MVYAPKPSPVAPPTIGFLKSQGVTATRVFCASIYCGRMVVVDFDDLDMPDDTPFPSIRARRRWTCQRCGNREVSVMPNWRDPRAVQTERVGRSYSSKVESAMLNDARGATRRAQASSTIYEEGDYRGPTAAL